MDSSSRHFILALLLAGLTLSCRAAGGSFATTIAVDTAHPIAPANPLVLGNNIQWVDRGDEMLSGDGKNLSGPMIEKAREMGVTLLRYPGGSLSDLYHWRDGMGPLPRRGSNEHFFSGRKQRIDLGTQEFLEICEAIGAQPMITVNTATGSPEDAAEWVRLVNVEGLKSRLTGKPLPKVDYWEVGNEPYLKDEKQKKLWTKPEDFARKASRFIEAMRKVDASIRIAIPLRSDIIGGKPATPLPGFNEAVLRGISAKFDFAALHNAYLPLDFEGKHSEDELYWASVAAPRVVEADFAETRKQLARFRPGEKIGLAVTEFNRFFSMGRSSDAFVHSPTGALYVADLLRVFAYSPDLAFANFWSLSGNWHFGAIGRDGRTRPVFEVLRAYSDVLRGNMLPVSVKTKMVSTRRAGYVPAMDNVPLLHTTATREGNTIRMLIANRDPEQSSALSVEMAGEARWDGGNLRLFQASSRFDVRENADRFQRSKRPIEAGNGMISLSLPPVSFAVLEIHFEDTKSGKTRTSKRLRKHD